MDRNIGKSQTEEDEIGYGTDGINPAWVGPEYGSLAPYPPQVPYLSCVVDLIFGYLNQ